MLQFEAQCGTGCLKNFNEALNIIRRRHLDTVPLMARAVMKLGDLSPGVNFTIQYFLNRYSNLRSTRGTKLLSTGCTPTASPSTC